MTITEQEYVRKAWNLAAHEGLLPRSQMHEIINALCTNIQNIKTRYKPRGEIVKHDLIRGTMGAVW